MPIYSDTLFWFRANQSLLLILKCCMLSGEAVNSNSLEILTNVIPAKCGANWPSNFRGEDVFKFQTIRTNNCPW